jgi:hypothetical protein
LGAKNLQGEGGWANGPRAVIRHKTMGGNATGGNSKQE